MDDENYTGEMIGEGGMKQQLGSNQDEEMALEEEKGNIWDPERKPEELNRVVDREKKQARKNFGKLFGSYAISDGLEDVEGSSITESGRNEVDSRGGYGMPLLPSGKVIKLRGNSQQSPGPMMTGGDIRMRSTDGTLRLFKNSSNIEGIETASNAVPRQGKAGRDIGASDRATGTTATSDEMENRGSRGKQDTPEVTFKGKSESSDGYPMNRGKRVSKVKVPKNDTNERRIAGVASELSPSHSSHVQEKITNMQVYTNGANSQMFEQWAGSLKAKSAKQAPRSRRNDSLSFTGRPLVKGAAVKVGSRLMKISGKSNSSSSRSNNTFKPDNKKVQHRPETVLGTN